MKFTEMPYSRPDIDALIAQCNEAVAKFAAAESAQEQIEIFADIDKKKCELFDMESIVYIRNSVNMNDEFYAAEREYLDNNLPRLSEASNALNKEMLNSKFQAELRKEFGDYLFDCMEMEQRAFSPVVIDLMAKDAELCNKYQSILASAQIEFDGKVLNTSQLGAYRYNPDRALRKAAMEAEGKYFEQYKEELDEIYDQLVKIRTEMAHKLGFKDFVEYSYTAKTRSYTAKDVANFRRQVKEVMVPKNLEYKKQQAEKIGVENFMFYDDAYAYPDGSPLPKYDRAELVRRAHQMYSEMSPETKELFDTMVEKELFDLDAKPGKRPGGYCATMYGKGLPFIFANFNGTLGDVDVLTHEAGHALASFTACKEVKHFALQNACAESAETHSMSMEFLTTPWHHLFFEEDTAKYQESHTKGASYFIPYGVIGDYFQELVYTHPEWTPAERDACWLDLEKQFRPYLDYSEVPFNARGAGWQKLAHIYVIPFYYIEYSLAQTLSLQFFAMFLENPDNAWKKYMEFLRYGGTLGFEETIKACGLVSPFEEGSIEKICTPIYKWIDEKFGK